MIVGCLFDGDEDTRTSWEQHDVYQTALDLIVSGCRDHVTFAVTLLELPWPERWPMDGPYDHRTLQHAHDILAAAWRHRTDSIQLSLPFDGIPCSTAKQMNAWLAWLKAEVGLWHQQPRLIGQVMTILAVPNTEPGHQAEEQLVALLRERFSAIPWRVP